ncbi:hypothetical protein CLCR_09050 [Cladophialophora carrionii]|uniref:EF-hand domain-containing protein n=1 Tax=Cladophialophora carrionii TaxID=86049 RepID=A0A1C1CUP8_9EURO|nr:hypothetical protein CLCR_09050 [Cladophialophora carrionii]
MSLLVLLAISLWILQLQLPMVNAKCCWGDILYNECGDGSFGTPCCGYKKCNAFCCACHGTQVIDEWVSNCGAEFTSYVSALPGTTWTCRDSHVSTILPCVKHRTPSRPTAMIDSSDDRPIATITHMPRPTSPATFAHPLYSPEEFADLEDTFDRVCAGRRHKGRRAFSLDQYFGFFNVTDTQKGGPYANSVEGKFRAHDLDGDGMLTFDEIQLVCDADGCD